MTAADRLNRIVSLVAELSRDQPSEGIPLDELAARFNTSVKQIQGDIRALTLLGDQPEADWLQSLAVWQEEDRVFVSSMGPYRRPVRLLPDELTALRVALATEEGGEALAARLAGELDEPPPVAVGTARADDEIRDRIERAFTEHRCLQIRYSRADRTVTERVIEPHHVFEWEGRLYCLAWCRLVDNWRQFRVDRMLEAGITYETFERRPGIQTELERENPAFRPEADRIDPVTVRFSKDIARWMAERYPDHVLRPDGSVVVTLPAASRTWIVREVLKYGAEAELLEPAEYRDAVVEALGAPR